MDSAFGFLGHVDSFQFAGKKGVLIVSVILGEEYLDDDSSILNPNFICKQNILLAFQISFRNQLRQQ